METDTLAWEVDLVHDMFNERDANLILSISLSSSRLCDVWHWSWESSGLFSVKSVYKFLQLSKELGAQDDNSRHVPIDTICPVCKVTDETIYHCLVDCSFAKACWQQLAAGVNLTVVGSFANWFATVLQQADGEKRRLIAMIYWTRAQDSTFNPTVAFLTDVDGAETWAKPAENTLKINVDAAIFSGTATYSFTGVIRDETDALVEAFTCCRSGV
ncbi:hypothetical protein F8388_025218 [Cannabis sativa]|uniref:Reverse transcriptase zinc-binding domain-containing protein n=1 Tax=Cannabis sativa TaxID=3483 RepID=A0A7J6FS15_CANSA|nr:hypothetical protein F8388_025218 [Cannabis sativa]